MEQIIQLKSMRDAALERLQLNPDFKLVNSLDALIVDLEAVMAPVADIVEETAASEERVAVADDVAEAAVGVETAEIEVAPVDPVETEEQPENVDLAAKDLEADAEEILDVLAEPAASEPDDVSSAIEALEAELAQSDIGGEQAQKSADTMIN